MHLQLSAEKEGIQTEFYPLARLKGVCRLTQHGKIPSLTIRLRSDGT